MLSVGLGLLAEELVRLGVDLGPDGTGEDLGQRK